MGKFCGGSCRAFLAKEIDSTNNLWGYSFGPDRGMIMGDLIKNAVSFRIVGDMLDPAEITEMLGISPE